jgi:hypothetical protein
MDAILTCVVRHNSSSPPPSPPKQEFMKDGLAADDIWVMVEDELLSTAKLFTQHLHHAEYQRLKKIARSQNASAIQNISRPVDNRTELRTESRKKMEGDAQRWQGQNAITNIVGRNIPGGRNDPDSEEDDPWMRDPRLAGLMTYRESSLQLAAITGVKPKTRASEGYSQTSCPPARMPPPLFTDRKSTVAQRKNPSQPKTRVSEVEVDVEVDNDANDLDAPSIASSLISSDLTRRTKTKPDDETQPAYPPNGSVGNESFGSSDPLTAAKTQASSSDPLDDFIPKRKPGTSTFAERMAKRKAESAKRERDEGKRKSLLLDEIPTFLV